MSSIFFIKKFKAWFIRLQLHRPIGFLADYLIYAGYLIKMSRWVNQNKVVLEYNDFYNSRVRHPDRVKLYAYYLQKRNLKEAPINYLEFGVGMGNSLRWWTTENVSPSSVFWAFDTYEGLPERYGNYEVGTFSQGGNFPDIRDVRIHFIKGLIQDTLLATIPSIDFMGKTIIHVDVDLYSASTFVLGVLFPYMKAGDVIIFDEFVVPAHEFKAFDEFCKSYYVKLRPVGAINNYLQMIFEVETLPGKPKTDKPGK